MAINAHKHLVVESSLKEYHGWARRCGLYRPLLSLDKLVGLCDMSLAFIEISIPKGCSDYSVDSLQLRKQTKLFTILNDGERAVGCKATLSYDTPAVFCIRL